MKGYHDIDIDIELINHGSFARFSLVLIELIHEEEGRIKSYPQSRKYDEIYFVVKRASKNRYYVASSIF